MSRLTSKRLDEVCHILQNKTFTDKDLCDFNEKFFRRTWAFISKPQLLKRMNTKILCGGVGISSQAIELLIKCGFLNITFADGDIVQVTNCNRQNYKFSQGGDNKAIALEERLVEINHCGQYTAIPHFLNEKSLKKLLPLVDIFINSIDFDNSAFVHSHSLCKEIGVKEMFPFVLGRRAVVIVIDESSPSFLDYFNESEPELLKMKILEFCVDEITSKVNDVQKEELLNSLSLYNSYGTLFESDPQFGTGVYNYSALVEEIISNVVDGKKVESFPRIYFR